MSRMPDNGTDTHVGRCASSYCSSSRCRASDAVATIVTSQSEAGIDVVNDGEVSKIGYDACTVQYTTANGTADEGDYTPVNGTINFDVKKDTVIVPITILPNAVNETNRSFTFTISSPSTGAFLGAKTSITINILDDD